MAYYFRTAKMSVGYQKQPLLEDIEICLEKGEILTLIGPNGAGKSTILKSIAGQLDLIGGTVYIDGRDMSGMSGAEISRKMAIVLTDKLGAELMTCEDVVATGRYPYTGRFGILSQADYKAVEEAMELVCVTEIKDRDFTRISDGQRQRVMLARAVCQEPEVVILDEPTSYLDVKYKLEFLSVLQEMKRKKGLTVIMSLHELELAAKISDKVMSVNGEYVDRFGTPEEIFRPGYIAKLFDLSIGSFEEAGQSMELMAANGTPEVFVIAGDGRGRNVYRRLQRQGISFMTGILFYNDLDYPVAKALAAEVVGTESFEPISDKLLETAKRKIDFCSKVICCRNKFGSMETANEELFLYASRNGKAVELCQKLL